MEDRHGRPNNDTWQRDGTATAAPPLIRFGHISTVSAVMRTNSRWTPTFTKSGAFRRRKSPSWPWPCMRWTTNPLGDPGIDGHNESQSPAKGPNRA